MRDVAAALVLLAAVYAAVVVLLVCAAVGFWLTRAARVHVNFVTHPFEATIYLDGTLQKDAQGNPYQTPCTIEDLPPRVHHVEFRHEKLGRRDAGPRDFARERRIETRWDPGE